MNFNCTLLHTAWGEKLNPRIVQESRFFSADSEKGQWDGSSNYFGDCRNEIRKIFVVLRNSLWELWESRLKNKSECLRNDSLSSTDQPERCQ